MTTSKKIMASVAITFGLGLSWSAEAASQWALRKIDSRAPGGFRELSRHPDAGRCRAAQRRYEAQDPRGSYGCMKVPS